MDKPLNMRDDTREKLLQAAVEQFGQRGFHGASIAQISGELGLTKQALLYYFKRKEDLYAEVLKRISTRLRGAMFARVRDGDDPAKQFEDMILGIYAEANEHADDTRMLMRELLDNQRSEAPPETWYLKTFLDGIVGQLDKVEGFSEVARARKVAGVYQIIGALEYFVASHAVLARFYGPEEFADITAAFPDELRAQVRRFLEHTPAG